jgi:electron transport complex protein RnfG
MYRSMVGIGIVCGALIVSAFQWTAARIERNKADALQRAIFRVVPGAQSTKTFRLAGEDGFEIPAGDARGQRLVYGAYDEAGQLLGVAVEGRGMGYQDVIRVLWGYSPPSQTIVGFVVLESKETPGLGDKIIKDPDFLANFRALDVALAPDGASLANRIRAVKRGQKEHAWQVDGITGATVSSKAVAAILDASASEWLPRIRRGLSDLQEAP